MALEAAKAVKIELPQGSKLVQTDADRIAAIVRERGLSQEQANALLNEHEALAAGFHGRLAETAKAERTAWVKTISEDPEIGGEKLVVTQKNAMRVIATFMPQPLREKLKETGFGDYPDFVRFLNNIGQAMADDKPLVHGAPGGAGVKSAEDVLYGTTAQT
mgnify:FL=1